MIKQQATILTPKEVRDTPIPLPASMKKAAGLLIRKRKSLEQHIRQVRREWGRTR